ncbi:MAG: hypothetical protein Q8O86_00975 [Dehalococcoidia bacterium]|nr:hypothetical protein [Dehalococcoidia bacterium]
MAVTSVMIAMVMGEEQVLQSCKVYPGRYQLRRCPFPAVHQKRLALAEHHLAWVASPQIGQGTPCS